MNNCTQIDHIIVSVYGIFVIETKNYKGWIFGSETQRQWTQSFPNGRKYKFQNPLRQNYLHIRTLADLLALDISYFHSMIAFIGECELKTRDELPEYILTSGMVSYVKKKQDKILTEDKVKSIVEQIQSNRFSKSWRTNREHKAYLKDKHDSVSKQVGALPKLKPNHRPLIPKKVRSREVLRWSGQTDVEQVYVEQVDSAIIESNSSATVFMTPFDVLEFDPNNNELAITERIDEPIESAVIPSCPKCNSDMTQRTAKKGVHQGQVFFGCSKFPKCRGIVNIE